MIKQTLIKLLALVLTLVLLVTQFLPGTVYAATSASIRNEINALKDARNEIQSQMSGVEAQKQENWQSIEEMVEYKNNLDSQIFLLYAEVENLDEQISSYSQLIAQTQIELDEAQQNLDDLDSKNKQRIRAMEEEGEMSYWSVLFKANSFTDLIDRLNMIEEIQAADVRRLEELNTATQRVADAKQLLNEEKEALEESKTEMKAVQAELDEKRVQTDEILVELNEMDREYKALLAEYEDEKNALLAEIAAKEVEYTKTLAAEEEARRKQAEEEAKKNQQSGTGSSQTGGSNNNATQAPSTGGWMQPCSYTQISSAYGYRSRGWHNGVDFAAPKGTPIYASRSGTVTSAISLTYSYGNYVVINHGDGFSSLYAHMTYYVVSAGQYVSQGQLIGYVGSTGNSTGNHLHFTIFYNGATVNPMNYL